MSYWYSYRPNAKIVIGLSGLVIVATLLSTCSGSSSSTTQVELVSPPSSAVNPGESSSSTTQVELVSPPSSAVNPGGGAGPQTPPCGIFEVTKAEVISGQQFSTGRYQINTFGISCDEVMGDAGLFSQFLQLEDDAGLPTPWRFLEGAVGAPKFVSGPGIGFRVQRISD